MIYLDNAATTQIDPVVLESMLKYMSDDYGNPGSIHTLGRRAKQAVDIARTQTAAMFGCAPDQVIFTSGGSEGNNMVFAGLKDYLTRIGKTHIVVSAIEHDSVLRAAEALTKFGFHITYVYPSVSGEVTLDAVKGAITEETGLVSVMFANNETGVVNQVAEIGFLCRARGILFHCDCVQAAGQYCLGVDQNNIDFATISAHKFHGPKGIGALYARVPELLEPMIHGGTHQELGLRGGTENVPGIVGLGAACCIADRDMMGRLVKITELKQIFVRSLLENLPFDTLADAGIHINCDSHLGPGKILSLTIDGVFGETLVTFMDGMCVCISAGSACTAQESKPSHVLIALGMSDIHARQSVRLSFSRFNTEDEIIEAAIALALCIKELRAIGIDQGQNGGDTDR